MLKLKDGYTVFSREPYQYGDNDEVCDVIYDAYESRLSLEEAKELVARLNILLPANATWSYGYAKDLDFHGYKDPVRWIEDRDDYNALVEAGEIQREEYHVQ